MRIAILISAFICMIAPLAGGQTTQERIAKMRQTPDPAGGYRWQDYAAAHHWTQADVDAIGRDKMLIGSEQFKQVFQPYNSGYPVFVTSDSLLNAYHVLLEESIRRVESGNSGRLPEMLEKIWSNLATADHGMTGDAAMIASAKRRALVTIAVAMELVGGEPAKLDAAIAPIVAAEVKKVREGKAVEKPSWLGPPTRDFVALDYARFTPRGFYTQSDRLKTYFRAVAWLQAIPFRLDDDEQLLSADMVGYAAIDLDDSSPLFSVFDELVGKPDEPDLRELRQAVPDPMQRALKVPGGLAELRRNMSARLDRPSARAEINDMLRLPGDGGGGVVVRTFAARRTPDAVFFEQIMSGSDRKLPSGLDIAAALGSDWAKQHLAKPLAADAPEFDAKALRYGSIYCEYLNCLQVLLEPPDKAAPPLFSSKQWQAKDCQTVLAGWAQLRHTWQLQVKENVMTFGIGIKPVGFVEPIPDFYQRFADLCERTGNVVRSAGIDGPDFSVLSADTHTLIVLLESKDVGPDGKSKPHELTFKEENRFRELLWAANGVMIESPDSHAIHKGDALAGAEWLAGYFDKGKLPNDEFVADMVKSAGGADVDELWRQLQTLSLKLDALANKQLRGADFNDEENALLRGYGDQLANIMLYSGDSGQWPRDDAPKIADVYQNPTVGQFLEVGIGRPRSLYILYPYHGGEVLCEGAVMPYYEFPHDKPMTDEAWKDMLDSKTPPKPMFPIQKP